MTEMMDRFQLGMFARHKLHAWRKKNAARGMMMSQ